MGAHDGPAVGDRRVGGRELQRRHLHVTLADREVDVVADRPRPVGAVGDPAPSGRVLGLALERPGRVVALGLELVDAVAPGRGREVAGDLAAQVDPGRAADSERPRPLLQRATVRVRGRVGVGERTEVVEEHVVGHPQRVGQVEHPVGGPARVAAALTVKAELAGVVVRVADVPRAALERRRGRDRLERRSGRAGALDRAIDQRVATRRVVELCVLGVGERLGENVRVERRVRAHRVDLARLRVHRHERAAVRRRVGADRLGERALAGLLEPDVERQPQVVAGDGRILSQRAGEPAERVDLDLLGAVPALQVVVVVPLEPRLPDDRALRQAPEAPFGELGLGDRSNGPEQLPRDVLKRVGAQPHGLDLDAREGVLALLEVVEDVVGDVLLDRDVRVRDLGVLLGDRAADRRQPQDPVARHRTFLPRGRDPEHRRQAAVQPSVLERGVPEVRGGERHREVGRRDLNRDRTLRVDQDAAVAIEDLPARRGHVDVPDPVDARLRQVLVAGQDLEEPQPEEDDREHRQREAAEDRHAHRELRRQRRTPRIRGLDHRVGPSR